MGYGGKHHKHYALCSRHARSLYAHYQVYQSFPPSYTRLPDVGSWITASVSVPYLFVMTIHDIITPSVTGSRSTVYRFRNYTRR